MSQESVELATRLVDAFNRRDLDAFAEHCTADVEWFPSLAGAIEGGSYKGREGMERYFEDYDEAWERFMVENDEYRSVDDRVLACGRLEATGRGSGVPVTTPIWTVIEFRGGKVSRARVFHDHGEALRAAGLAE